MAKTNRRYVCQECGAVYPKWMGKCESCGAWSSLIEETAPESAPKGLGTRKGRPLPLSGLTGQSPTPPRLLTEVGEFDRVCGGGLVPGAAILIGGDPGIGKSTVLLQIAGNLAHKAPVLYITGEEAPDQVRLRAERLGVKAAPVALAAATNVRDIVATFETGPVPAAVIIDSIQTMYVDTIESAPGTVSQVRASAQELVRAAKHLGIALFLVGHVTKDGQIAGPRVLEHMVDTVLYFEGDRGHQFRILRAVKNRFGPTDEIGVFEMTGRGLAEVANPSELFLSKRDGGISGTAIFAGIEGTRPLLVEIQALVAPGQPGNARRAVVGWDSARLAMIIAVFEARVGVSFAGKDVFLNVAGGLRISEPAADLAVSCALLSALIDKPLPADAVIFGEIGLTGEIRPVAQSDARLKETAKLGFTKAIMPKKQGKAAKDHKTPTPAGLSANYLAKVEDVLELLGYE